MALIKVKPTSPGRRSLIKVVNPGPVQGRALCAFAGSTETWFWPQQQRPITPVMGWRCRHHYRIVDFRRNKDGIPAKVERLEYDPNRSAFIALVLYADGERRYVLA